MTFRNQILLLLSFSLFIVLISCNNDQVNDISLKRSFDLVDSVRIALPISTPNKSNIVKYYLDNDQNEILLWYNSFDNSILLINLNDNEVFQHTIFEKEGPEKISTILGITILAYDSIFLQTEKPGLLYQVDTSGKIISKYVFADTSQTSGMTSYTQINSRYNNDIFRVGENTFVVNIRNPTSFHLGRDLILSFPLFALFTIENHSCNVLSKFGNIPKSLVKDNGVLPSYRSSCFDGKNLVYTFAGDHNLYVSQDLSKNEPSIVKAKSDYLDDFKLLNKFSSPYEYDLNSGYYRSIFYDKFGEIYYRVVKLDAIANNVEDMVEEYNFPSNFSIIILDQDFNIIQEIPFYNTYYDMNNIFPTKKGLFISKSNPKRKNYSEDFLEYDIYRLN